MFASVIPMLMLPWPVKIIIDNVIEGRAIDDPIRPYPGLIAPILNSLASYSLYELLFIVIAFQTTLFLVIGAFGASGSERETAEGYLASGYDTASRTENEANSGFSLTGGFLGLFDFRWTMRLTQSLNHYYRTQASVMRCSVSCTTRRRSRTRATASCSHRSRRLCTSC